MKKPRGLRVNKPELPEIYIPGNRVMFLQYKDDKKDQLGYVFDAPVWTHDGYWEMDIVATTGNDAGKKIQILWNPKIQKWINKTF